MGFPAEPADERRLGRGTWSLGQAKSVRLFSTMAVMHLKASLLLALPSGASRFRAFSILRVYLRTFGHVEGFLGGV
jgi:hypothetical protein